MAATKDAAVGAESGSGRSRSPNFPSLSLPDALKKVKVLYDADGRVPTSGKVIMKHLGYGENISGSAGRVLSALRQYGLLQDAGGDKFRVSEPAFHILTLSEDSSVRKSAIESAARRPAVFAELLNEYPEKLPSDSTLRDSLISDKKFNPVSIDSFIRSFKATLEFAKLHGGVYNAPKDPTPEPQPVAVGDFVQWESQGAWQFSTPKRLVGVSEDGAYAFIDGVSTGIPMDQIQKADAPAVTPKDPRPVPANPFAPSEPVRSDDVFSLSVPFSKGTINVQVSVTGGAIRPAHLARVRKYLQLAEDEWDEKDDGSDNDEPNMPI